MANSIQLFGKVRQYYWIRIFSLHFKIFSRLRSHHAIQNVCKTNIAMYCIVTQTTSVTQHITAVSLSEVCFRRLSLQLCRPKIEIRIFSEQRRHIFKHSRANENGEMHRSQQHKHIRGVLGQQCPWNDIVPQYRPKEHAV